MFFKCKHVKIRGVHITIQSSSFSGERMPAPRPRVLSPAAPRPAPQHPPAGAEPTLLRSATPPPHPATRAFIPTPDPAGPTETQPGALSQPQIVQVSVLPQSLINSCSLQCLPVPGDSLAPIQIPVVQKPRVTLAPPGTVSESPGLSDPIMGHGPALVRARVHFSQSLILFLTLFIFLERERESTCWIASVQGGRGRARPPSRLPAAGAEPDLGLKFMNPVRS